MGEVDTEVDGRRDGAVGRNRDAGESPILEVADRAGSPAEDRGGGVRLGQPAGVRDDRDCSESVSDSEPVAGSIRW